MEAFHGGVNGRFDGMFDEILDGMLKEATEGIDGRGRRKGSTGGHTPAVARGVGDVEQQRRVEAERQRLLPLQLEHGVEKLQREKVNKKMAIASR